MKKASRITAFLLMLVLCCTILGAAFCLAGHADHDCTGEGCTVCAVLEQCSERLHEAGTAAAALCLLTAFAWAAVCLIAAEIREAAGETPVTLKVKLLN